MLRAAIREKDIYLHLSRRQKAEELWRIWRGAADALVHCTLGPLGTLSDLTSIYERPNYVDNRSGVGHCEGDLVTCEPTSPLLVLHERPA